MKKIITISFFFCNWLVSNQIFACTCIWPDRELKSIRELDEYDFVAHVLVLENNGNHSKIEIKELFKGKEITKVFEPARRSSCGYGIQEGSEWILFGKSSVKGMVIAACDRNIKYKSNMGTRDWKYERGISELRQLRKLYQKQSETFTHGIRREYYYGGKRELEENYAEGKRHGERKIWYPNGVLYCRQNYVHGNLNGKSEWFYPSGQIYDEEFYDMGKPVNVSRLYFDSAYVKARHRIFQDEDEAEYLTDSHALIPQYETIYDSEGRAIIRREYSIWGKIRSETVREPDNDYLTEIFYHENGLIESISQYLDDTQIRPTQRFDKRGVPEKPILPASISDKLDKSIPIQANLLSLIQQYEQDNYSIFFVVDGIPSEGLAEVNQIKPEDLFDIKILDAETAHEIYGRRAEGRKTILIVTN